MFRSRFFLPGVVLAGLFVLVFALRSRHAAPLPAEDEPSRQPEQAATERERRAGVRTLARSAAVSAASSPKTAPLSKDPQTSAPARRTKLTGYLIDDFSAMSGFPRGYLAEDVRLTPEGVALAPAASPEAGSRHGLIESPPLALRRPSRPLIAQNAKPMPPGCSVHVEISLSEDGKEWTPWALLQRYHSQSFDLEGMAESDDDDGPTTGPRAQGPYARYRMTLSSDGPDSPVVRDLRIWHLGSQEPEPGAAAGLP